MDEHFSELGGLGELSKFFGGDGGHEFLRMIIAVLVGFIIAVVILMGYKLLVRILTGAPFYGSNQSPGTLSTNRVRQPFDPEYSIDIARNLPERRYHNLDFAKPAGIDLNNLENFKKDRFGFTGEKPEPTKNSYKLVNHPVLKESHKYPTATFINYLNSSEKYLPK